MSNFVHLILRILMPMLLVVYPVFCAQSNNFQSNDLDLLSNDELARWNCIRPEYLRQIASGKESKQHAQLPLSPTLNDTGHDRNNAVFSTTLDNSNSPID